MWIRWIARAVHAIGRSASSSAAPPPRRRTNAPTPSQAARARPRSTATPPRIAGTERTGRANSVATLISETAVNPVAIRVVSMPPPTSSRYWVAAPTAAPPGSVLLIELPASCEVPIRKYRLDRRHSPISVHMQTKLATSSAAMTRNHTGFTCFSSSNDPKTATTEGHTTYRPISANRRAATRPGDRTRGRGGSVASGSGAGALTGPASLADATPSTTAAHP